MMEMINAKFVKSGGAENSKGSARVTGANLKEDVFRLICLWHCGVVVRHQ